MTRSDLVCVVLLAAVASPNLPIASADPHIPRGDWSWVKDTFWYVTEEDLPAVVTDLTTSQHSFVIDQTVWQIEEYSHGYFWGKTVVQFTGQPRQCLSMVGSITPEGAVQMTFALPLGFPVPGLGLSLKTSGLGIMRLLRGEWRVEMQMTTGVTELVTHWAYMAQCRPGDECNQQLPGVAVPLQQFLLACTTF